MTGHLDRFRRSLRSLLFRVSVDEEVEAELAFHLEMRTRDLMAQGMSEPEAREHAAARFGDMADVSRRCRRIARGRERDLRLFIWWQQLRQDVVFAIRQLRRAPVLSAVVVLTIAAAIAANTTVFGVSRAVVLRPLPYPEADRLVRVQELTPEGEPFSVSTPTYLDLREQARSFTHLGAVSGPFPSFNLQGPDAPVRCSGIPATGSVFRVLGVEPVLGRVFTPEEERPGGDSRVVILSDGLWRSRFGSDDGIVGTTIALDGVGWTVIGVMPAGFAFLTSPDVWVPIVLDPASDRGDHRLEVYGRLADGVSMDQLQADLASVAGRLSQLYPVTNGEWGFVPRTFYDWLVGPRATRAALVLTVAVGLVLLLACANVSNLMIAQVTARFQEIGTRAALGASRGRIVRQLLTESTLMAFLGAALGLALAVGAISAIRRFASDALPRLDGIDIDLPVIGLTVLVALATGALSGFAPALRITGGRLADALTSHRHTATPGARRVHDGLVVSELALAVMLLIGAGLLVRSSAELDAVDPGFVTDRILTVQIDLPPTRYPELSAQAGDLYRRLTAELEALPGVESVGATMVDPFRGPGPSNKVALENAQDLSEFVRCQFRIVSSGFFATMGVPVLRGRVFDARDRPTEDLEGFVPAVVVSAELAERLWEGRNPVGQLLRWSEPGGMLAEVVGVVGGIRDNRLDREPQPMLYFNVDQAPWPSMTFMVRTQGDPAVAAPSIPEALDRADSNLAAPSMRLLARNLREATAGSRLNALLLGVFSALALLIAVIGVYGVFSYRVARRKKDFGIRMAMGARRRSLIRMVLAQGSRLVAIGVALGALGSLGLTRFLAGVLFETSPTDPMTFCTVILLFTVVAITACYPPARKAAGADPCEVLRAE